MRAECASMTCCSRRLGAAACVQVRGDAVVGKYPILEPGAPEFVYQSCTHQVRVQGRVLVRVRSGRKNPRPWRPCWALHPATPPWACVGRPAARGCLPATSPARAPGLGARCQARLPCHAEKNARWRAWRARMVWYGMVCRRASCSRCRPARVARLRACRQSVSQAGRPRTSGGTTFMGEVT